MTDHELVQKCVKDHKGVWPFGYFERYAYWDEDLGWNLTKGASVYYGAFDKIVDNLKTIDVLKEKGNMKLELEEILRMHSNGVLPEMLLTRKDSEDVIDTLVAAVLRAEKTLDDTENLIDNYRGYRDSL